jgi:kynurenine formamidase
VSAAGDGIQALVSFIFGRRLMASRHLTAVLAAVGLCAVAGVAGNLVGAGAPAAGQAQEAKPTSGPGPSAARYPKTADDFDAYFKKVSNWGRWGKDDELGTLNLITPEKRKQAASLVKVGQSVGLAHTPLTDKTPDNFAPYEHAMNKGNTSDRIGVSFHGYAHSHMDSLCHMLYKDQTYNGFKSSDVNTDKGCTKLSIANMRNGYVTRGILIDIPRLRGVPYLEPGTPIFIEDIEAWEKKAGVKVSSGDAFILRTGRWARRDKLGPWDIGSSEAGLHASTVQWLKDRGVSLIASDSALDVMPSLVESQALPVHVLVIAALGLNILDNQDLEPLGDVAAKQNRWEFLLTVAPVPVAGGTGFPVNALATF